MSEPELKVRTPVDMIMYAARFVGVKYNWGGDSADEGFDCSGFICEVLRGYGFLTNREDLTAQQLYDRFHAESNLSVNSLVFYGKSLEEITHIAISKPSWSYVFEAGGEGRVPTTKGMVRQRPKYYRNDFLKEIRL